MTLGEKQRRFTRMLGQLIQWAYEQGFELTLGEAYRTDEQAEINALGQVRRDRLISLIREEFPDLAVRLENNSGYGIRGSLHEKRLAVDLHLFIGGVFQTSSEAYKPLGEKWEALGGSWGGRFSKPDGNHFSLEHQGIR